MPRRRRCKIGIAGAGATLLASMTFGMGLIAEASAQQCTQADPCVTSPLNLGTLGGNDSYANGVSADGSVVVGASLITGNASYHAFVWTSAGMVDIGTLGGSSSGAEAVSADGLVVVGGSHLAGDATGHAFRWTLSGGIEDLGTLGGTRSSGRGVNADGSVVVGESLILGDTANHAFRWTNAGMADLGTLGGTNSVAVDVSADGSVVVGASQTTGNAANRAFRWTSSGMIELEGFGGDSNAFAVSADGSVAVGNADITAGAAHAVRWTSAGVEDLGTLGGQSATALDVSADGSVVVGYSQFAIDSDIHAFRWTATAGMNDLNTLLTDAGVDMTGIVLVDARGVSANGQFIVGKADFSGDGRAYVVRYFDQEAPDNDHEKPIAGITTREAVQTSVDQLSDARFELMAQQHALAAPLLSDNQPIKQNSETSVFGTAGSAQGGAYSRIGLMPGLTLLGGASYGSAEYVDADIDDSFTVAAALRYVKPNAERWHPFAEGGGWFAPDADLKFERTYMNGAGTATGVGRTEGDISYIFARAGLVLDLSPKQQLAFSAELGHEWLDVDGYSEPLSSKNPFEATVASGTDSIELAKARAQWSFGLWQRIDATLWAAAVWGFDRKSELVAFIPGFGPFVPLADDESVWAEYGARVGYAVTGALKLDIFVNGAAGSDAIGSHAHGGAGLSYRF